MKQEGLGGSDPSLATWLQSAESAPFRTTTLAVAMKLIQQGRIPKDESIVISITGNGLKTQEVVVNDLVQPAVIEARMAEFDRLLEELLAGR